MDMSRFGKLKTVTSLMILTAVVLGAVLALTVDLKQHANDGSHQFPIVTLGLTAEARQALQQSGDAFPSNSAGFSAYYRVPDGSGGFSLDKGAVDQSLFSDPGPTLRRAGVGTLIDMGGSHTIGAIPINNIDGLISSVNIYYDDQGWIVAYFSRGTPSSQVWQAVDLSIEDPVLTDVSRTTLMDAINDVLVEALNKSPLTADQLGYYHWEHPTATDFLMIATARGITGSDFVSFAVPGSFTMLEVSVSMWISESTMPCARTVLDGTNITGDQCDRSFNHLFPNLSDFNSRSAHSLELAHFNDNKGASGALVMLVYVAQ